MSQTERFWGIPHEIPPAILRRHTPDDADDIADEYYDSHDACEGMTAYEREALDSREQTEEECILSTTRVSRGYHEVDGAHHKEFVEVNVVRGGDPERIALQVTLDEAHYRVVCSRDEERDTLLLSIGRTVSGVIVFDVCVPMGFLDVLAGHRQDEFDPIFGDATIEGPHGTFSATIALDRAWSGLVLWLWSPNGHCLVVRPAGGSGSVVEAQLRGRSPSRFAQLTVPRELLGATE